MPDKTQMISITSLANGGHVGLGAVEGYTAEMIARLAPFMDGVGVYNFLVTLRERPDNGKRIIVAGFPRK
ncbi:MAG: hypothetical protein LBD86_06320 [Spirochaetaceae bacterium]|jgi:hypothetical protein|nr:hypothetical protein [Spirochaetaceae bacterium]